MMSSNVYLQWRALERRDREQDLESIENVRKDISRVLEDVSP